MPKVSVLIPVYKTNEDYLKNAIGSVLNQTFKDFELVIIDDCPTDTREDVIKSFNDKRIKYQVNTENQGISKVRNKLLDLAQGEYVAIMDHDDESLPTRLEKEVEFLDKHKEYGVVSSSYNLMGTDKYISFPEHDSDIKRAMAFDNFICHTGMMVRRSLLTEHNIRYEEQYSPAEDYMICLRLMEYTLFYNFKEPLVKYRFHENNTSKLQQDKMDFAAAMCRNFAQRQFPYYYHESKEYPFSKVICNKKSWVKLFGKINFIKIKKQGLVTNYYLFGFLPIFTVVDVDGHRKG
ncbi:MAG: glycosyltransferase [Succinivibrio sp.]|nr:glycosyltransferase [Succinivibrio sp.]